jgi:class 3 adenylate cyclase/tetratricopeptide (TPR) repeat protein
MLSRGGQVSSVVSAAALTPRLLHGIPEDADRHLRVEGTAVVVDISGFTTLSEQLAAAGREGTEQLIATLSRIFTVLLPVTDDGGDVVKFAGDALFILFTGPDHARHAVHAAWNMNRVLTAIGDIHLPAARARLRMSVGVHSGTYDVVLVGDGQVGAILTGAATARVLALQDAAEAGRILVSDETAAFLPAGQVTAADQLAGAHRLLRAGSVATASLMALSAGRAEASTRFLPRAFADRPDLLAAEPDHRWAAIGFVRVSGVGDSPTAADIDRMDGLTRTVELIAAETGVTLLDIDPAPDGYRYFLTAGAPTSVEDPEGRLITAAARIVATDTDYTLQAGVTSGRVFAGFVGAHFRQTYTVMGDPTNLAARLTSRAEPGTVLVARAALERTTRAFATRDPGEVSVKGKTAPIPVAVVTDAPASGGDVVETRTDFVGRAHEVAEVGAVMAAPGRTLVLTGPAGIGKSRLVAQSEAVSGVAAHHCHGDRYAASTPFRALQPLVRTLLEIAPAADSAMAAARLREVVEAGRPDLEPWLALIAPAAGAVASESPAVQALDDAFRAERTAETVADLLGALLDAGSCLVVDDAQWVDAASAAALTAFAGRAGRGPLLVARRDEGDGFAPEGERLALEGLTDDDAADLVEAVAGRRMLPADLAPVLARAAGNPLYLIELAASTGDDDTLGIEQLVGERIDALSESDRTTLRRAAVLGTRIPLGLYLTCVGMPLLSADLSTFLELGVDTVSFRSELFRDVAYAQLTFQSRRELHRAAAAKIEAEPALGGAARDAMLAVHYEAAGDWEAARDAATRAAAAAEKSLALEDAVRSYRRAVEAARHTDGTGDELPRLLEALGRVAVAGGWAAEGLEAFSGARALLRDAVERARIDRERAYALNVLGRPTEAVRALRSARRALAGVGESGRAVLGAVAVTEAGLRLRQGRWSDARTLANEAISLLDGLTDDATPRVLADAYRYHDIAASELEGDGAMVHLQRALELYDAAGDELSKSKVLSLLGVRAYYRGEWTIAAAMYGQARAAAEAAGDVVGAAIESANAAEILVDQGRRDEALPLIRSARRVFEASDNPYLVAFVTDFAGRAHQQAGDVETARDEFAASAAGFDAVGEADAAHGARVRLAEVELDAAELDAARTLLGDLDGDSPRLVRQRARLALADGDADTARSLARSAADDPVATPLERGLSLALVAQLEDDAAARAEAARLLDSLGVVNTDSVLTSPALPPELVVTSPRRSGAPR